MKQQPQKTACKHEDGDYIDKYQGMTDEEVKSRIMSINLDVYRLLICDKAEAIPFDFTSQCPSANNLFLLSRLSQKSQADGETHSESGH